MWKALYFRPPIELTAEEAFWHASTGTEWEQRYAEPIPVRWDRDIPTTSLLIADDGVIRTADRGMIPVGPDFFRR